MLSLKLITDARKLSGLSLAPMAMVSLNLVEQSVVREVLSPSSNSL
mgnify:CR=1 FL=1